MYHHIRTYHYACIALLLYLCIAGIQVTTGETLEHDLTLLMGDGISFAQTGQYELSYEVFSEITSLYPEYPNGWLWKGTVLHELNRSEESQEAFVTGRRLLIEDEVTASRTAEIPPSLLYQSEKTKEQDVSHELNQIHEVTPEETYEEIYKETQETSFSLSPALSPSIPSTTSPSTQQETDTPFPFLTTTPSPSPAQSGTPSTDPALTHPLSSLSSSMTEDDEISLSTPESPSVSSTLQPTPIYSPSQSLTPVRAIQPTRTEISETEASTQPILTGAPDLMGVDLHLDLDLSLLPDNVDNKENSTGPSTQQPIEISFSLLFVISLIIGVLAGYILLKVM